MLFANPSSKEFVDKTVGCLKGNEVLCSYVLNAAYVHDKINDVSGNKTEGNYFSVRQVLGDNGSDMEKLVEATKDILLAEDS